MKSTIISCLQELGVSDYIISEKTIRSSELFFIKRSLDMTRVSEQHSYSVDIYRDFEENGKKFRGDSNTNIYPCMTADEVKAALSSAYLAAGFVHNAYYPLPEGASAERIDMTSDIAGVSSDEACKIMSNALFAEDTAADAFINSAELFLEETTCAITSSTGTDVSYRKWTVWGEFVAQCKTPQDVESYQDFRYENLNTEALKAKVRRTLDYTRARAAATEAAPAGNYRIIISDNYMKTFFSYYKDRTGSSVKYAGYSKYEIGDNLQVSSVEGAEPVTIIGDKLNISLKANNPYSGEGLRMIDRPLLEEGILKTIHGDCRFAHYLGIEPTGNYGTLRVEPGKVSLETMKKTPYLHVVNFSDFQMDAFTGHFGGEIRLAFLFDGEKVTPVTGGSVNGSILNCQHNITLSSDVISEDGYEGAQAICLENIPVAGI